MDRQPRDLPSEVPQRDVHHADRTHGRVPLDVDHLLEQSLTVQRVLAQNDRLQVSDERPGVELGASSGGSEESVAFNTLVCRKGQKSELAVPTDGPGMPLGDALRDALPFEDLECPMWRERSPTVLPLQAVDGSFARQNDCLDRGPDVH